MGIDMAAISGAASSVLDKEKEKFDSLSESEKEQKFLSIIDEIKMNQDFQNFEKWWNKLGVKKKMQYYKDWEVISVKWSINYATKMPWTLDVSLNPFKRPRVRWVPNPVWKHINPKKNIEESIETSVYEQFPWLMRIWVSFGLLKKPWILPKNTLLKNIKTDANTLATNLWIFEKVCRYVPQLMAIHPLIQRLLPYAEWYKEHGASLMQEKLKNNELKDTETSTTEWLSQVEQDIVKTEVVEQANWWKKGNTGNEWQESQDVEKQTVDQSNWWGQNTTDNWWEVGKEAEIEVVDQGNWWESTWK